MSTQSGGIDLYFALKPGRRADLEVVSAAALQWVEAMRIAARRLEPNADIRVELVATPEGSLRLSAVLDWVERKLADIEEGKIKHPRLKKLAVALALFVVFTGYPTYDFYFGDDATELTLNPEDRKLLEELLQRIGKTPDGGETGRKFFKILERDPAISGVGVTEKKRPIVLVPSGEFAERSGLFAPQEEDAHRTLYPVYDVVLVSPVLIKAPRSWRFKIEGMPEFTAVMNDHSFLQALESSHVQERLRTGIPMTLRLEIREKKVNGEWQIIGSRKVIEVISPRAAS